MNQVSSVALSEFLPLTNKYADDLDTCELWLPPEDHFPIPPTDKSLSDLSDIVTPKHLAILPDSVKIMNDVHATEISCSFGREVPDQSPNDDISPDKEDKKFMEVVTKDDTSIVLFWQFLAVKKFTHFGEQMKKIKKVSSLSPYFYALLETGILQEIANDVFDFNEMNKVNKLFANQVALITAVMEYTEELDGQLETYRDKFKETLKGNIDA